MTQTSEKRTERFAVDRLGGPRAWFGLMGCFLIVAGCASVPNAINPAEWYKSVEEAIAGGNGDGRKSVNAASDAAGADETPKSVEETSDVDKTLPARSKSKIPNNGLDADMKGHDYSGEIPGQGKAHNALAPEDDAARDKDAVQPTPSARPAASARSAETVAPAPATPTAPQVPNTAASTSPEPTQVADLPQSPQLVITDASQTAYQQRLDAMRARLARSAASNTPPFGQSHNPHIDSASKTVIVSGEGMEISVEGRVGAAARRPLAMTDPAVAARGTRVATILFPNGSASLSSRDRHILAQVAALQKQRGGTLRVIGHSSSRTKNMALERHKTLNMNLSIQRADRVATELRRLGVRKAALVVAARGDAEPIYYEIMPSGEAGNRRAEVYLID